MMSVCNTPIHPLCFSFHTGSDFVMISVRKTPIRPLCFPHREWLCHDECLQHAHAAFVIFFSHRE